jgi:UDP-3-O-[3-hydroxymyristoyl] glucosamine N-acyltransferase
MKFPEAVTVQWMADLIQAEIIGDANALAYGINEIHRVEVGDFCFVDHPKYYDKCLNSAATHIIINTKEVTVPVGKTLLVTDEPFEAYLTIVKHFRPFTPAAKPICDSAVIGAGTVVMPNCFIGKAVTIGRNCIIHPNVTIHAYTEIGDNVVIQSGTVIGSDAFYYNTKKSRAVWYKKMLSCGNVVIEDDVEIGANCTIDRGVTADTRIGKGSRLDNLVHIGHDIILGNNCLIAAQVGIAGGTVLEDGVILWGQVGVNKTIRLGENAVVMGQSGVVSNIEGNKVYWGTPAIDVHQKKREVLWAKRIPELWKKVMG